ncbi:hypothetical protein [Embleya sp. NBC_00896]|uniref:hypothetical protein n=1 Tax=Embleya sp. NBC_00896 TaxID=2975961 RepID=UPI00386B0B04|nr:hypothetical protein OG928_08645 [Embleya sp. NBC_00896]
MTDFVIDLAWLDGVSGRLAEAASVSKTTLDALEEIGPQRTGHKDLDKACSAFHEKWDERIRGFTQGVEQMRQGVAAAKASYGATEAAVAASFPAPPGAPATSAAPPAATAPGQTGAPAAPPAANAPAAPAPAKSRIEQVMG